MPTGWLTAGHNISSLPISNPGSAVSPGKERERPGFKVSGFLSTAPCAPCGQCPSRRVLIVHRLAHWFCSLLSCSEKHCQVRALISLPVCSTREAEKGAQRLAELASSAMLTGLAVTREIAQGNPAATILAAARMHHVDLSVLCSHGRSGMMRPALTGQRLPESGTSEPCARSDSA